MGSAVSAVKMQQGEACESRVDEHGNGALHGFLPVQAPSFYLVLSEGDADQSCGSVPDSPHEDRGSRGVGLSQDPPRQGNDRGEHQKQHEQAPFDLSGGFLNEEPGVPAPVLEICQQGVGDGRDDQGRERGGLPGGSREHHHGEAGERHDMEHLAKDEGRDLREQPDREQDHNAGHDIKDQPAEAADSLKSCRRYCGQ